MTEATYLKNLYSARDTATNWMEDLTEEQRTLLSKPHAARAMTCFSFLDGYLRIRRTVPLILRAIERLDSLRRRREAAFWMDHLKEEAFHDELMRADLARMLGSPREASVALRKARITPPSAALVGYFEWQVALGDPALLIAMRIFLEWYIAGLEDWRLSAVDAHVDGGCQTLRMHRELDRDHVAPCDAYIAHHCRDCMPELRWSIEFAGRCLRDAHLYLADGLLRHCE